jgi:hypothetical protein
MTFEGRNLHGHTYNHNETFMASKKKKWRPNHHELAFGKASTRPPWYRNERYGGVSALPGPLAGRRFDPKGTEAAVVDAQHKGEVLHHFTGESQFDIAHSSNLVTLS